MHVIVSKLAFGRVRGRLRFAVERGTKPISPHTPPHTTTHPIHIQMLPINRLAAKIRVPLRRCISATPVRCAEDEWKPPAKVEDLFARIPKGKQNSPVAGARTQQELPEGKASLQLYSLGTPNGQKVSILLEELQVDYDAHLINIAAGDQYTSGFVAINPNSKIPAMLDRHGPNGQPVRLFESASIMVYLANKYQQFLPRDPALQAEAYNWLFWQMSALGPAAGNFGHYFLHAPPDALAARDYSTARYGVEVQRLCSLLDQHLHDRQHMIGDAYSIVDMICLPWINQLLVGMAHGGVRAKDFLSIDRYGSLLKWAERCLDRPATQRGISQVLPMYKCKPADDKGPEACPKCTM